MSVAEPAAILWRRVDRPGHESARLARLDEGWELAGTAVFAKEVRAAWLRFPSFRFEPLEQSYRRLAADRYFYRSAGGRFEREIEVDRNGFVIRYPDFWEIEP